MDFLQQFDDGSALATDGAGNVTASTDTTGMTVFPSDAQEQARMGQGYPANGMGWDWNAAMFGVSRLIDTAGRTYASVKGSMAPTYAGQNGQTYSQGQNVQQAATMRNMVPLLLIAAVALVVLKKG